jgi:riboflavin transporter FmnP
MLIPAVVVAIGFLAVHVTNFWLFKHRISSIGELVVSAIAALIIGTFGLLVLLGLFTKTQTNDLTHRNTRTPTK